jgi:hypothetical protein
LRAANSVESVRARSRQGSAYEKHR